MSALETPTSSEQSPSHTKASTPNISATGTSTASTLSKLSVPSSQAISQAPGFPQFKKLPMELRKMIWAFATPQGRTIKVHHTPAIPRKRGERPSMPHFKLQKQPVPTLLHVNSESRHHAFREFTLFNDSQIEPVFFNVTKDTILMCGPDSARALRDFRMQTLDNEFCPAKDTWQTCEVLAKRINHVAVANSFSNHSLCGLSQYRSLKTIVFSSSNSSENDSQVRVQQKVNWAMNLVRENETLEKKTEPLSWDDTEGLVGRLGNKMSVSKTIRNMVEEQEFKDVPLLTDVVVMDEVRFGREFDVKA